MRAELYTREEHAGPQNCESVEIRSPEHAVLVARTAYRGGCGCCAPSIRAAMPDGRVLKADPWGYWLACRHGRHVCPECGDPALPRPADCPDQYGPAVPGAEYHQVLGFELA